MKMIRKIKNIALAALALLSVSFGSFVGVQKGVARADESTVSTAALIGSKTKNVTVTAGGSVSLKGKVVDTLQGLSVAPNSETEKWSADIDAVFTGNSSISYFLPNQYGDNSNASFTGNGFYVKNLKGETVAVFVNMNEHYTSIKKGLAYVYDAIDGTYESVRTLWQANDSVNIYAAPPQQINPYVRMDNNGYAAWARSWDSFGDDHYISPKVGTEFGEGLKDGAFADGTVYFNYDDTKKVLSVQTTTYDAIDRDQKRTDATGNGQILTLGTVNVDLSDGYTVTIGSAPSVPKIGQQPAYDFPYSSSVLITEINGFNTASETVTVTDTSNDMSIRYHGEYEENGKNVIELTSGDSLEDFYLCSGLTVKSSNNKVLSLRGTGRAGALTYANNKAFYQTESITVEKDGLSKTYVVKVESVFDLLTETAMRKGAQLRVNDTYNALRFTLQTSAEDKAKLEQYVGADKPYTAVYYGMIIMPYSYIEQYGDVTVETLFGENAVYKWDGKTESGTESASVYNVPTEYYVGDKNTYYWEKTGAIYYHGMLTNLTVAEMKIQYIGVGYIELTRLDGGKEYRVFTLYDTETSNNVRSAYDVALSAYKDKTADEYARKGALNGYLIPCGYTAE